MLKNRPRDDGMTKSELIEIITFKQKHLPAKDVESGPRVLDKRKA